MSFTFGRDWQRYVPGRRRGTNGGNGHNGNTGSNGGNRNGGGNGRRNSAVWGDDDREGLTLKTVAGGLAGVPRVLKLVWDVHPPFTVALGVLYILQGLLPALTAAITGATVQSVLQAFLHHGAA